MDSELIPSVFDFNMQGFSHCTARCEDGTLVFYPSGWWVPEVTAVRVQPTAEAWHSFRVLLDALDAWSWQDDFGARIICGSPWTLRVEWAGKSISCAGNGASADSVPLDFKQFLGGLAFLIGTPNKLVHLIADDSA